MAAFFAYMSFDDGSRFHERIGSMFGEYAPVAPNEALAAAAQKLLELFPSYDWQLAFFPLFAAMAAFLLVFLFRELKDDRHYALVLGAVSCWIFAVLLDFIEGASEAMALARSISGADYGDIEHLLRTVEETLELSGATLMLTALLAHLTRVADGWTVHFAAASTSAAGRSADTREARPQTLDTAPVAADC